MNFLRWVNGIRAGQGDPVNSASKQKQQLAHQECMSRYRQVRENWTLDERRARRQMASEMQAQLTNLIWQNLRN